jgi:hypothetical protein
LGIDAGRAAGMLELEVRVVAARVLAPVLIVFGLLVSSVGAEEWSAARIHQLPDSAFAGIEVTPEGRTMRHLPHHDETGAVDPAHLRAARARLGQVDWRDPASREAARRHLEEHWRDLQSR